jgi:ElaB/YqjD/DUF883 family membrane-anchored ribosome-binding protein
MGEEASFMMDTDRNAKGIDRPLVRPVRGGSDESPEEIQQDIERTRAGMGETLDEIEQRLSPQRLKDEAIQSVRDNTIGRAEQVVQDATDSAKGTGRSMLETIRQNPLPAALAGIGLGWLYMNSKNTSSVRTIDHIQTEPRRYSSGGYYSGSYGSATSSQDMGVGERAGQVQEKAGEYAEQAQDMASQYAGQAQERASQLGHQAQYKAHDAYDRFDQLMHESPLVVGAVAIGLGAAMGLAIPETRRENEMMGEARDSLIETAQQKADETMQKAEHVVSEAKDAAQQEAQQQGLSSS